VTSEEVVDVLRQVHRLVWIDSPYREHDHQGCATCGSHGPCFTSRLLDRVKPADAQVVRYPFTY
jgi:hypothetical protein